MKRFLAIVETDDEFDPTQAGAVAFTGAQLIPQINPDTFFAHWNAGINAMVHWESFCENLFQILTRSGLIDEQGLHHTEYNPGSVCRFLLANEMLIPEDFRESMLGYMVMSAIKTGANIKKGKDIVINWNEITAFAAPMTRAVLTHMLKTPHRSAIMLPIISEYFPMADETVATENTLTISDQ